MRLLSAAGILLLGFLILNISSSVFGTFALGQLLILGLRWNLMPVVTSPRAFCALLVNLVVCISLNGNTYSLYEEVLIQIECSAPYMIDVNYGGIRPTEAIKVEYGRIISKTSPTKTIRFTLSLLIYSNSALFNFYKNLTKNPDLKPRFYSRSGLIEVFGKYNTSRKVTLYQFLEENAVPVQFLTTPSLQTTLTNFTSGSGSTNINKTTIATSLIVLNIPCIASHFNIGVNITHQPAAASQGNSLLRFSSYNYVSGFTAKFPTTLTAATTGNDEEKFAGTYTCFILNENKTASSEEKISFNFPSLKNKDIPDGFERLPVKKPQNANEVGVQIHYRIPNAQTAIGFPRCQIKSHNKPAVLASISGRNVKDFLLMREFISPKYFNMSYSLQFGQTDDHPVPYLSVRTSYQSNVILTFCQNGDDYQIVVFGVGLDGAYNIWPKYLAFDPIWPSDWKNFFPLLQGGISIFIKMDVITPAAALVANTSIEILCSIHKFAFTKPIIWTIETTDGKRTQELIDYKLKGEAVFESRLIRKLSKNVKKVCCAAPLFFSEVDWKEGSVNMNGLIEPEVPKIANRQSKYSFKLGSIGNSVNCKVSGKPNPQIYWQKNGKNISYQGNDLSSQKMGGARLQNENVSLPLNFPTFLEADEGIYTCVAYNEFGRDLYTFEIKREGTNIALMITLPITIFLSAIAIALIYFKYFKKEKYGLTREEIQEFLNGTTQPGLAVLDRKRYTDITNREYQNEPTMPPMPENQEYNKAYEIPENQFQIDENAILGSGAFGVVYRGIVNGCSVAAKTVKRHTGKQYIKSLLAEIKIMIYLGSHPNIVHMIGAHTKRLERGILYVFIELCPLGSLENYLRNNRQNFVSNSIGLKSDRNFIEEEIAKHWHEIQMTDLLQWVTEISYGMEWLASKHVVHGDLAARNVLLSSDRVAQITDFGLSKKMYGYANYVKKQQEPLPWRYMAIEALKDLTFSTASDVWAFGITVWEIYSLGEVPYPGFSWTLGFVQELENGVRMSKAKHSSEEFHEFLMQCWDIEPSNRPTFPFIISKLLQKN